MPIANGKVNVVARWRTNARGTGYRVVVATTEPVEQTYAACSAGRSCRVSKATISPGLEMTWKVTIVKTRGNRVVGGLLVCLVGRS